MVVSLGSVLALEVPIVPDEPLSWGDRLRRWRKANELTQLEAAEELVRLAWLRNGEQVAINADMVSKWERGRKRPIRMYRELIGVLTSKNDSSPSNSGDQPSSVPMMVPEVEDVDRREFLAVGLLGAADFALPGASAGWPESLDSDKADAAVASIRKATSAHRRLDATIPSRDLAGPVLAHLRFAAGVGGAASPDGKHEASAAVSEVAGFAAWLHWDLLDVVAAQRYYSLAVHAAEAARQPALTAYMLGSLAQLMWEHGDVLASDRLLSHARRKVANLNASTVFAWLSALEARTHAVSGDRRSAYRCLDVANDAAEVAADTGDRPWPWMSPFAPSKVAAQRAMCALDVGDHKAVHTAVSAALVDGLGDKQRALLELTRADALLRSGDVEMSFRLGEKALRTGLALDSRRVIESARQLRRSHEGRMMPAVRDFDERLRACQGELA